MHLINRISSRKLNNTSPYKHLFKTKLAYDYKRIFGCLCYIHLRPYTHFKLESRSLPCVFLGYIAHYKGFWYLESLSQKAYVFTHVVFKKNEFLFLKFPSNAHPLYQSTPSQMYASIPTVGTGSNSIYNTLPFNVPYIQITIQIPYAPSLRPH